MKKLTQMMRGAVLALTASVALSGQALAQETLKVGSTPTGVPFTFLDVKTNQIDGDHGGHRQRHRREEGFDTEIEPTQWAALIPSLTAARSTSSLPRCMRRRNVRRSWPSPSRSTPTARGCSSPRTTARLCVTGRSRRQDVGAQVGTAYYEPPKSSGKLKEVKVYDSIADIMRDVALGRIDAGFGDRPIVAYQLSKGASQVRLVEEYESSVMPAASPSPCARTNPTSWPR